MNITKILAGLLCIGYMACHSPKTTTTTGTTGNTETVKKDQYQFPGFRTGYLPPWRNLRQF